GVSADGRSARGSRREKARIDFADLRRGFLLPESKKPAPAAVAVPTGNQGTEIVIPALRLDEGKETRPLFPRFREFVRERHRPAPRGRAVGRRGSLARIDRGTPVD